MKLIMNLGVLEKLLQSMYHLLYQSVLHLQDKVSCLQFVDLIAKCLGGGEVGLVSLKQMLLKLMSKEMCSHILTYMVFQLPETKVKPSSGGASDEETKCAGGISEAFHPEAFSMEEVSALKKAISMIQTNLVICWLPEYGSVMIIHCSDLQVPGVMTVSILGLDKHSFFLHGDGTGGYNHESDAKDYKILIAGMIQEDSAQAFLAHYTNLLNKAQQCQGDHSKAVTGLQGHQYTLTLVLGLAT